VGTRNRERRKAKQKAARQQQQRRAARAGSQPFDTLINQLPPQPPPLELAELLVVAAVQAWYQRDAVEFQNCRRTLAEGMGVAGGRRAADRALLSCLQRCIGLAWRNGWQPADVVRVARRDRGARHGRMLIDLVASQMRQYAAATVDEQWEAQLRTLDAVPWWERDDHYFQAWGEREKIDRAEVVDCAVELLCLLDRLPKIPTLCPPPGTARRGSLAAANTSEWGGDQRMLDRVRALLAKAESTGFPEEAEAFTAKAQELMARHSIDYALLSAKAGSREEPTGRRMGIDNPYEAPKMLLLGAVAGANRCRSVWSKEFGFATIFGYATDLDAVELLYTSLLVQATTAIVHAGSQRDRYGRSSTRSFRQSFLTAYAHRIGERLRFATQQANQEATQHTGQENLLPVLVARDDAVRTAFETMFPGLNTMSVAVNNAAGWASGLATADRASLHTSQPLPQAD
jgi:hypothetical protein